MPERCPETVPVSNMKAIFVFEFMGHCPNVPIKTLKMKTCEDLLITYGVCSSMYQKIRQELT